MRALREVSVASGAEEFVVEVLVEVGEGGEGELVGGEGGAAAGGGRVGGGVGMGMGIGVGMRGGGERG